MDNILHQISEKISKSMATYSVISSSQINVYTYGMELLLSSVLGVVALSVVSLFCPTAFLWIPYLAGFVPLRLSGGGFHAKSHRECLMIFTSVFIAVLVLHKRLAAFKVFSFVVSIVTLCIISILSPVETANKKLTQEQKTKNRLKSTSLGIVNLVLSVIALRFSLGNSPWIAMYFTGYGLAGGSMVIAVVINMIERRKRR